MPTPFLEMLYMMGLAVLKTPQVKAEIMPLSW
jgi:hypothetical protein